MPDSYHEPTFYVHASNIHTSENQVYGPFVGPAQLTYDILRANEDEGPPFEIFQFHNAWYPDIFGSDDPSYSSWVDQEGDIRYDGWRALERLTISEHVSGTKPVGPYWTDLVLVDGGERNDD